MGQIITDKNILNQLVILLRLEAFNTLSSRNYCRDTVLMRKQDENTYCAYTFSAEGIIDKAEIEDFPVFGFDYSALNQALGDIAKTRRIEAYQKISSCNEHYEDLLGKISTTEGWKVKVPDKWGSPEWEGIFGNSLVFAPYRSKEPRVFTVRDGLVTTLDHEPDDSIGSFYPVRDEAKQKAYLENIGLDRRIINAFTEAHNLNLIYSGINGAARPS